MRIRSPLSRARGCRGLEANHIIDYGYPFTEPRFLNMNASPSRQMRACRREDFGLRIEAAIDPLREKCSTAGSVRPTRLLSFAAGKRSIQLSRAGHDQLSRSRVPTRVLSRSQWRHRLARAAMRAENIISRQCVRRKIAKKPWPRMVRRQLEGRRTITDLARAQLLEDGLPVRLTQLCSRLERCSGLYSTRE